MARFGFIGNTDSQWFDFLLARPGITEINFWRPGEPQGFKAIEPGAPFFFRRKAPDRRIGGFGHFAGCLTVSLGLAWDSFGQGNGVESLADFIKAIGHYRGGPVNSASEISCIMLSNPQFFPKDLWVPQREGWGDAIVFGAKLDLDSAEGLRIWQQCQSMAGISRGLRAQEAPVPVATGARYGAPILVLPRAGQGIFRMAVTDAYGQACAVTNEHSLPVLDAAHIKPHGEDGAATVSNGLLLRADIHRLFDAGYVTVTPDYRFEVSKRLKEDFNNGKIYYDLHGRPIRLPARTDQLPDRDALIWHNEVRFVG